MSNSRFPFWTVNPLRTRAAVRPYGVLALIALLQACSPPPLSRISSTQATQIQDVVDIVEEIELQEGAGVINVSPRVNIDSGGGFIVADPRENQVRIYSPAGELVRYFGRKGHGPGEFERVSAAVRLGSGDILTVDMGGRLTRFAPDGTEVRKTHATPLFPIYDVAVVNDTLIALAGRLRGQSTSPLIHLWNLRKGGIVRSFFQPDAPSPEFQKVYAFTGFADVAVRGDTLAVAFALSDTIYLFGLEGDERRRVKVPFRSFRTLSAPMPSESDPEKFREWTESFSTLSHLFWSPDGTFLVQFFDMAGHEAQWRLLHMGSDGTPLFEVQNSPRLLAVLESQQALVFMSPASETPNKWALARIKP